VADENKTIAVFDGDASGAKKAAADAAAAVRSQAAALEELASAEQAAGMAADERVRQAELQSRVRSRAPKNLPINMGGAPKSEGELQAEREMSAAERLERVRARVGKNKPIDMLGGAGKAAEETAKGYDQARISAEAFSMLLGRINPELGSMAMIGTRLKDVMASAFTPAGLMTGGLLASLAAVGLVINEISETIARSKQNLADMEATRARLAKDRLEAAGEVGKALAESGAGSEQAVEAATKVVRKSEMEGFNRDSAVKVAAKAEAAGMSLNDEERRRLTMGVQLGAIDLTGRTAAESRASVNSALGKLGGMGPELQQAFNNAITQTMRGTSIMKFREAGKGTQDILEDVLRTEFGLDGEQNKRKAEEVRAAVEWNRSGRPRKTVSSGAVVPGVNAAIARQETEAEAEGRYASGLETIKAIESRIKAKQRQVGQQSQQTADVFVSAVESDYNAKRQQTRKDRGQDVATTWAETFDADKRSASQQGRVDQATGTPRPTYDPDRQNSPPIIGVHGGDARTGATGTNAPAEARPATEAPPVVNIVNTGITYVNASDPRMKARPRMPAK
jgi:hypothetical protein